MSERAEAMGPVATTLVFENDDVKIWEADVAPGEDFPLHQHNYDYVLFTTGPALLEVRDYGREPSTVPVPGHAAIFIPAGGIESYGNVARPASPSSSRDQAAAPRRSGAGRFCHLQRAGWPRPASGRGPSAGEFPGANRRNHARAGGEHRDGPPTRRCGGIRSERRRGQVVERDANGSRSFEESRPDRSTRWMAGGVGRELHNLGSVPYRELSIQVK